VSARFHELGAGTLKKIEKTERKKIENNSVIMVRIIVLDVIKGKIIVSK
jgi:hypothetical protein